jgi:hypothetical protein
MFCTYMSFTTQARTARSNRDRRTELYSTNCMAAQDVTWHGRVHALLCDGKIIACTPQSSSSSQGSRALCTQHTPCAGVVVDDPEVPHVQSGYGLASKEFAAQCTGRHATTGPDRRGWLEQQDIMGIGSIHRPSLFHGSRGLRPW